MDDIIMNLDALFKEKGVKKNYAAREVNVDPTTMSSWSKGKTYPDLNQAVKLSKILDCELGDLYIESN